MFVAGMWVEQSLVSRTVRLSWVGRVMQHCQWLLSALELPHSLSGPSSEAPENLK